MKTGKLLVTRSAVDTSVGSLGRALGVSSGLVTVSSRGNVA